MILTEVLGTLLSTSEGTTETQFPIGTLSLGGLGTALVGAAIWAVRLILDRSVPSRTTKKEESKLALEGMKTLVTVLQEEKKEDAARMKAKQDRIDQLESEADKDFNRIVELRNEVLDLRNRLAVKDQRIQVLVLALRRFGQDVAGLGSETGEIQIQAKTA